jgi:Ni/Fe-hydrogenase subunit HybB-like protein
MTTQVTIPREQMTVVSLKASEAVIGLLACLTFIGLVASLGRLLLGLSASTALTDGYPWGIWIGFDFTLIAFSGVGFTMTALVHIFHLKKYQPVLRPAILAGLLGYSAVLVLLVLDLGRPDRFYNFLIYWNLHSPLFEISWCILLYTTILVIETCPCLFQRLGREWPVRLARKFVVPVSIIGVTLSTLHQSTLGTLYLNMPHRLDALWYTSLLPLLFFISSIMAGLSLAILIYKVSTRVQGKVERFEIVDGLGQAMVWVTVLYLLLKSGDLWIAGQMPAFLALDRMSLILMIELIAGALIPAVLWLIPAVRTHRLGQWGILLLILSGVMMNRFNATMYAQTLPPGTSYSPHIIEWLSTIGILAGVALVWYLGVRFLAMDEDVACQS